jgi:uncharacterized protein
MDCPACGKKLSTQKIGPVELDVCDKGCNGVWFDAHELKKFDEAHEPAVAVMLNSKSKNHAKADTTKRRNCPKCKNIVMLRRFSSPKKSVEVDECGKCAGIWLDVGELAQIRKEFATEAERNKAAEDYVNDSLGPQLLAERDKSRAQADSAKRIANALKFICPSFYIPGKQKGGAF